MRNLLLVLGLGLAAGAVVWLALGAETDVTTVDPASADPGGGASTSSAPPPPRPAPTLEGSDGADRTSAALPDPARLRVTVCDREGGPLPDARITLRVDDQVREQVGRTATFEDLRVDTVQLRVEHEGLPTWERQLVLEAGKLRSQVVKLQEELLLRGRVLNRFGDTLPGEQVWFLRPGERHPSDASAAQRLQSAVSDRDGKLSVSLPSEGSWRLSVGRVNEVVLTDPPRTLSHGGPNQFEVVLAGHTHLEVRVAYPGGPEPVTAAVLARREDLLAEREEVYVDPYEEEYEDRKMDLARQKRIEAARSRGFADTWSREQPAPDTPDWANRQSRRVANDGQVVFQNLPPGQELRMALIRTGERFESDTSFSLTPDQRAVVELDLPASTGSAELSLPLPLRWRSEVLDENERPAGIHWRN